MSDEAAAAVVVAVPDLFFASKISQTAKLLGATIKFVSQPEALIEEGGTAKLVLIDLAALSLDPLGAIARIKQTGAARVIAFANHENTTLMEAARQAGGDEVLTRGAFAADLPRILGG
jgi:CheY-like chemotaxis protein